MRNENISPWDFIGPRTQRELFYDCIKVYDTDESSGVNEFVSAQREAVWRFCEPCDAEQTVIEDTDSICCAVCSTSFPLMKEKVA